MKKLHEKLFSKKFRNDEKFFWKLSIFSVGIFMTPLLRRFLKT